MEQSGACLPPLSPSKSTQSPTRELVVRLCRRSYNRPLRGIKDIPGTVQRVFLAEATDGGCAVLKLPPLCTVRLLRHEKDSLAVDANFLRISSSREGSTIPKIIANDVTPSTLGSAYTFFDCGRSVPLSSLSNLTTAHIRVVERTLALWLASISCLPASSFGFLYAIMRGTKDQTWRLAFARMVESTLRDGEDMLVSLPYDRIRMYIQRFGPVLDTITTPGLLFINACDRGNILVDPNTMAVTGLIDYSSAVWGDPELAACSATSGTSRLRLDPTALRISRNSSSAHATVQDEGKVIRHLL
ncbi:hypothetical protein M8818_000178 [Zalaria obscura]|uniref:Uncharacterized protein n=1 Tax=Zalaria obscura TaxID=2024903 RepID=A0ACC3SPM3_9PEZI